MGKVVSLEEVVRIAAEARADGCVVVTTNGCFDILHVGHARNLAAARDLGDLLIVGVNSDASVRENKGSSRPIVPEDERAEIIASLAPVDYVFIFDDRTPFEWIRRVRPTYHVKGGGADIVAHPDYPGMEEAIRDAGAKFILVPHHEGSSTSQIIGKILDLGDTPIQEAAE